MTVKAVTLSQKRRTWPGKGQKRTVETESSECSAGTRKAGRSVSVCTNNMKARTRKKMGAAWPSGQHCHENNGQRLVVNKLMWNIEVFSS